MSKWMRERAAWGGFIVNVSIISDIPLSDCDSSNEQRCKAQGEILRGLSASGKLTSGLPVISYEWDGQVSPTAVIHPHKMSYLQASLLSLIQPIDRVQLAQDAIEGVRVRIRGGELLKQLAVATCQVHP